MPTPTRRGMSDRPDPQEEPWCKLSERAREALWAAGYTTSEAVARIRGRELHDIKGIGTKQYQEVRRIWPNPPPIEQGLVVPSHGGGALLTGGPPGNTNRAGGPHIKQAVRRAATEGFATLVPRLVAIARDELGEKCPTCGRGKEAISTMEQIRAIDTLGKYGPGTQHDVSQFLTRDAAVELVGVLAERVKAHVMEEDILVAILEDWRIEFLRRFPPQ